MAGNQEKSITVKTAAEIEIMRQANRIVAGVLSLLQKNMRSGLTTMQMDKWAEEYCRDHGAEPAFKGYRGFPGSLCISVNEQVVHGIPCTTCSFMEIQRLPGNPRYPLKAGSAP